MILVFEPPDDQITIEAAVPPNVGEVITIEDNHEKINGPYAQYRITSRQWEIRRHHSHYLCYITLEPISEEEA